MAKYAGRDCVMKIGTTPIAGARTTGLTVNGTPISSEDQYDNGIANYLSGKMTGRSVELTVEGLEEDGVLRNIALGNEAAKFISNLTFEYPANEYVLSGDFVMTAYTEGNPYEDAGTFSATFSSNGAWTLS